MCSQLTHSLQILKPYKQFPAYGILYQVSCPCRTSDCILSSLGSKLLTASLNPSIYQLLKKIARTDQGMCTRHVYHQLLNCWGIRRQLVLSKDSRQSKTLLLHNYMHTNVMLPAYLGSPPIIALFSGTQKIGGVHTFQNGMWKYCGIIPIWFFRVLFLHALVFVQPFFLHIWLVTVNIQSVECVHSIIQILSCYVTE